MPGMVYPAFANAWVIEVSVVSMFWLSVSSMTLSFCSSSGTLCPVVMSFRDTRAQRKHLALEALGRELVRKVADFGAEDRVRGAWEGRRASVGTGRVSSRPSRRPLSGARPGTGLWDDREAAPSREALGAGERTPGG